MFCIDYVSFFFAAFKVSVGKIIEYDLVFQFKECIGAGQIFLYVILNTI